MSSVPAQSSKFSAPANVELLTDVLSFWYPNNNHDGSNPKDSSREYLNEVAYFRDHIPGWMFGKEDMDLKCQSFRDLVRSVAKESTAASGNEEFNETKKQNEEERILDNVARLILFDQIARNAFRFQDEAYAYNEIVIQTLEEVFQIHQHQETSVDEAATIPEEALSQIVDHSNFTFCDCFFIEIACQHQEQQRFHGVDIRILHKMAERWPAHQEFIDQLLTSAKDHLAVLQQFGRYPQRNHKLGRENTIEEQNWLSDYDNLPYWVKSQLPQPA